MRKADFFTVFTRIPEVFVRSENPPSGEVLPAERVFFRKPFLVVFIVVEYPPPMWETRRRSYTELNYTNLT